MDRLNITNGSNTVDLMNAAGIAGDKLSWDDLLHEGPVPGGKSLGELSAIRAAFISQAGYAEAHHVNGQFLERDRQLVRYSDYQQVVLWFEHDLYDQLQLIQLLDWFHRQANIATDLQLICVNKHLGHHKPAEFPRLESFSRAVSPNQSMLASESWRAFTADSPLALNQLIGAAFSELPLLKPALQRLMMEYPASDSGLPLTESLILQCLQQGSLSPATLFAAYTKREVDEFLGDSPFFKRLNQMAYCEKPLVDYAIDEPLAYPPNRQQSITITPYGHAVLAGQHDWFDDNTLTRWIGGCLVSPDNRWRYNPVSRMVDI